MHGSHSLTCNLSPRKSTDRVFRAAVQAPFHRDYGNLRQSRCRCFKADCPAMAGGADVLAHAVESYLAVRRATGFRPKPEGSLLQDFEEDHSSTARTQIGHFCRNFPSSDQRLPSEWPFASVEQNCTASASPRQDTVHKCPDDTGGRDGGDRLNDC